MFYPEFNVPKAYQSYYYNFSRYFAICHPLKLHLQSGKRRNITIVATIWVVCLIPSIIWSSFSKVGISKHSKQINPNIKNFRYQKEFDINVTYSEILGWVSVLQSMGSSKTHLLRIGREKLYCPRLRKAWRVGNVLGE